MKIMRNTAYNLLGTAIPLVVALATVPVYLSIIGPIKFGLLSISFLILGYFGIFDFGLGRAVAHRIATNSSKREGESGVFGTAVFCNLVIGIVGSCILWLTTKIYFGTFLDVESDLKFQMLSAIPALAISVPITALTGVFSGALEGKEKFARVNAANTISSIMFHTIPLAIAMYGIGDLASLVTAACFARIFGAALLYGLCVKEFGYQLKFDRNEVQHLFGFGGWVALSSLVGPLMVITDRFLIGALIGPKAVANYTIPFEIGARTAIIPHALSRALFPQISAGGCPVSLRKLSIQAAFLLASVITPLTVIGIFAMRPFMEIWLGDFAEESIIVGQIILVAFWVNAMCYIPLTVIVAGGKPKAVAFVHCIELFPYLIILYFLTRHFGIEGAAIAFLVRCIADYIILGILSGLVRPIILPHTAFLGVISSALICASYLELPVISKYVVLVILMLATGCISWLSRRGMSAKF